MELFIIFYYLIKYWSILAKTYNLEEFQNFKSYKVEDKNAKTAKKTFQT
jgi:hypothetical protein